MAPPFCCPNLLWGQYLARLSLGPKRTAGRGREMRSKGSEGPGPHSCGPFQASCYRPASRALQELPGGLWVQAGLGLPGKKGALLSLTVDARGGGGGRAEERKGVLGAAPPARGLRDAHLLPHLPWLLCCRPLQPGPGGPQGQGPPVGREARLVWGTSGRGHSAFWGHEAQPAEGDAGTAALPTQPGPAQPGAATQFPASGPLPAFQRERAASGSPPAAAEPWGCVCAYAHMLCVSVSVCVCVHLYMGVCAVCARLCLSMCMCSECVVAVYWCVCVCVSVFKMVQDGLVRAKCSGVKRGMVHC